MVLNIQGLRINDALIQLKRNITIAETSAHPSLSHSSLVEGSGYDTSVLRISRLSTFVPNDLQRISTGGNITFQDLGSLN